YTLGKRLVRVAGHDRIHAAKLVGDGKDFAAGITRVELFGIAKVGARSPFVHDGDDDLGAVAAQSARLLVDARGEGQEGEARHVGGQRRVGRGCGDGANEPDLDTANGNHHRWMNVPPRHRLASLLVDDV